MVLFFLVGPVYALEPDQILVIANSDIAESVKLAEYYCTKRDVPEKNILNLSLGTNLTDSVSRENYNTKIADTIRDKLSETDFKGRIKCLLTTYGIPFKVGKRKPLKDKQQHLEKLKQSVQKQKNEIEKLNADNRNNSSAKKKLEQLQSQIDYITGQQTNASLDSELSMVLFDGYELYQWQVNKLKSEFGFYLHDGKTLMVARIDGPVFETAKTLIDKAVKAEKTGLKGIVYIDSRGIEDDNQPHSFGHFDQSLRDLAILIKLRTQLDVKQEQTGELFPPDSCPETALYCGWYSLKKYIDAFEFVDGAVGYHVASFEAADLRSSNSSQWCPAMLKNGITATLGAVDEPYLQAFPEPREFFLKLLDGHCLAEAYYMTKPFNSWQMLLIGDPLYKPFGDN